MARPWGGASKAWSDEVEAAADNAPLAAALPEEAFPSLGEAAKTSTKKKGQKGQKLSLGELHSGKYVGPAAKRSGGGNIFSDDSRLTPDEIMSLPTGPKERTEEELNEMSNAGRLGGGFRDFRGDRDRGGDRGGDRGDREQRGFGFDRERDSSRADESSDWGANKSSFSRGSSGGRYDDDRRGGGGNDRDMPSKADEVDSWTAGKKFVPSESGRRSGGYGGFEETRRSGGYGGFEDRNSGISKADAEDNWSNKKSSPSSMPPRDNTSEKWSFRRSDEDSNGGADADRWSRRGSSFVDEQPRRSERPRLNLQPRTLPVEQPLVPKVDNTKRSETEQGENEDKSTAAVAADKEGELAHKAKVWDGTSSWRKSSSSSNDEEAAAAAKRSPSGNTNAWKKADNVVVAKDPSKLDRW